MQLPAAFIYSCRSLSHLRKKSEIRGNVCERELIGTNTFKGMGYSHGNAYISRSGVLNKCRIDVRKCKYCYTSQVQMK